MKKILLAFTVAFTAVVLSCNPSRTSTNSTGNGTTTDSTMNNGNMNNMNNNNTPDSTQHK